jgi:hypothetical protein
VLNFYSDFLTFKNVFSGGGSICSYASNRILKGSDVLAHGSICSVCFEIYI